MTLKAHGRYVQILINMRGFNLIIRRSVQQPTIVCIIRNFTLVLKRTVRPTSKLELRQPQRKNILEAQEMNTTFISTFEVYDCISHDSYIFLH